MEEKTVNEGRINKEMEEKRRKKQEKRKGKVKLKKERKTLANGNREYKETQK
jgi:hypothetical protein